MNLEALFLGNRRTISGTVYGTIVVLAAITGTAKAVEPNLWSVAVIAAVTSGLLWVAHVYSHGLGESVTIGRRLSAAELAALARREGAILRAAVLPVFVVVLGALGLFHARTALWLAVGVGVATLTIQGIRFARLEELSTAGTIASVGVNLALGLSIVIVKALLDALAKSSGPDGFISRCVRDDDLTVGSFPPWFRRWGVGAWLVVGMALVVVAAVWLLSLTSSIVGPLIAGAVIGAVGGVVVDALERRGWPRVAGAAVVTLTLAALTLLVVGLVLGAITSQAPHLDALLSQAVDKVQGWAQSLGITSAADAAKDIKKAAPDIGRTLLKGVASGISGLKSLVVFLGFTIFTSFFLLKDGPSMGRWIERHMGMQPAEARIVTGDILQALRKYFFGLTIVGAFNTAIVTLGALVLGVPLLGTVALVTFLGAYVPIIGAWTAGILVFALTLADEGTTSAIVMGLIIFAANGPLQQVVQPIVFGATLRLNPLVVFSVTIAAGTLFGMVGLILAAPLVSAAVRVHDHLAELRTAPAVQTPSAVTEAAEAASPP